MLSEWTAHLCGLCLALRGDYGQFSRTATNYDGLVVSVLVDAQSRVPGDADGRRRTAGPCPLRGMRGATVAQGEGARLAAAVSLVLASAKVRDHVADGDGMFGRRPVAAAARRVAAGWNRAGARSGAELGFDTAVLTDAVDRQQEIEAGIGEGGSLLDVTEPTETATAAAFAHTAVLAGRPGNAESLAEAGRLFGRLAHLLDAVEDLADDAKTGAWNPVAVTATPLPEVRRLCDDAVHGVRLALRDVEFVDGGLAHVLLAHELKRSVDRVFGPVQGRRSCTHHRKQEAGPNGNGTERAGRTADAGEPGDAGGAARDQWPAPHGSPGRPEQFGQAGGPGQVPPGGGTAGSGGRGGGGGSPRSPQDPPPPAPPQRRRGLLAGCAVWTGLCVTGQLCCRDPYVGPWSGREREGWCRGCGDTCGDCCGDCFCNACNPCNCDCDCDCGCCDC